ncbi:MAG: EAL domain-containing protein [Geminicoccaceae bacterium]|nr:EAL domain-containing protein [Geminicoccaceae bacterium]
MYAGITRNAGWFFPGEFISVLNASPLASQFSRWVMETACRQAREWHDLGYPIRVGVNVSQGEFRAGLLRDSIESVLVEAKLPACLIEIEVTEDVVLDHGDETVSMLHSLREQGVSIAFDDFGTGYASLVYLKRFPLDRLKVDRSFVGEIGLDREDEAIVRSIIDLGRHLNLEIIAEGVETSAQAEFLRGLGCRQAQGFHFGGAVPAAEFEALVVTQATTTDQRRTSLGNPFPGRRHNVDHKS